MPSDVGRLLSARLSVTMASGEARAAAEQLLKADGGVPVLDKLLAAAERESRAVMALARSMRLTLQAKYDARAAGRAANGPPASDYET